MSSAVAPFGGAGGRVASWSLAAGSPDQTALAYLAGIVDADGYITATASQRRGAWYFGAQVGITGSRREPHDLAASIFGGNVFAHSPSGDRTGHKVQFHWQRHGRRAVVVIEALMPYLRVKVAQAVLAISIQEELTYGRADRLDPWPWMHAGYDPTQHLLERVAELREHNCRRRLPRRSAVPA